MGGKVVFEEHPGTHALGAHHFADHRREAAHDVVAGHRPGCDAAFAMAGDAFVDE